MNARLLAVLLASVVTVMVIAGAVSYGDDAERFQAEGMSESSTAINSVNDGGTQALKFTDIWPTEGPETAITSANPGTTPDDKPTLTFTGSDDTGVTGFECRVDAGSWGACASPYTTGSLSDGSHTFYVRAKDAANNVDATPASQTFTMDTDPYDGIRFTPTVGIAKFASDSVTGAEVDADYADFCTDATSTDCHGPGDSADFVVQTKITWPDMMKNPGTTPTLAQMRDPDWSGYIWNDPTDPDYDNAAEVDDMLSADCVQAGDCKVSLNIGTGATGGTNPPAFMKTNGWAWDGQGCCTGTYQRVKWYDSTARQYAENFTLAVLERFDDPNISGVKLGEYFSGNSLPTDWTSSGGQDAYEDGYYDYAANVVANAPTDANGDRVAIYQTNPQANADVFTSAQMESLMLGIAGSNAQMFEEPTGQVDLRAAVRGSVPMSAPLDDVLFNNNRTTAYTAAWDGADNPFGFSGSHVITVPQIAWYYGHCGPAPMDQEFITKPGEPTDEFVTAMDQFGPGGSDHSETCSPATDAWGGVPFVD